MKTGDRMPYYLVDGESIHSRLHAPKFHLLVFGSEADTHEALRHTFEDEFREFADQMFLRLDERVKKLFGTDKPFAVLLRPDNHIALISSDIPLGRIRSYFDESIARPPHA